MRHVGPRPTKRPSVGGNAAPEARAARLRSRVVASVVERMMEGTWWWVEALWVVGDDYARGFQKYGSQSKW